MHGLSYETKCYNLDGKLKSISRYDNASGISEIVENGIKKIFKNGKLIKQAKY